MMYELNRYLLFCAPSICDIIVYRVHFLRRCGAPSICDIIVYRVFRRY